MRIFTRVVELHDWDGWKKAVDSGSGYLIIKKRVPFYSRFRVCWGGKRFPTFVDGKHVFRCLGCVKLGFRKYRVKVRVKPKHV